MKRKRISISPEAERSLQREYLSVLEDESEYDKVKKFINNNKLTLEKIINLEISLEDKVELVKLYEVFDHAESMTLEKLNLEKEINLKIKFALSKYKEEQNFLSKFSTSASYKEPEQKDLKYIILSLDTTEENKNVILYEYFRMQNMASTNEEKDKISNWLFWALSIPFNKFFSFSMNLSDVFGSLNKKLFGMQKTKEQILLFLNSRMNNPKMKDCSLGLVGPVGCGKTSIIRILAETLNFPLEQISLGGIQSAEYLKGHQATWIGAEPGEIVKRLRKLNCCNGMIFFDEYDKITANKEVCAALLHITDSSQNKDFQDSYLGRLKIDLSNIWFIYSMNTMPVDDALSDRIFYVTVDPYTQAEKYQIATKYLLPEILRNINLEENTVSFKEITMRKLIERVSPSSVAGVRALKKCLIDIVNKVNFIIKNDSDQFNLSFSLNKKSFPIVIDDATLKKLL